MTRGSLTLLVSAILLGSSGAAADTFGGWRYVAPPGYTAETFDDHVALTKATASSYCSIAIFEARRLERDVAAERAYEWYNTVTHAFTANVKRRGTLVTKTASVTTTIATLTDDEGHRYAASHFIVTPPGTIGSVLVLADTHASLASCGDAASGLVRSLVVDRTSPRFTDPEATPETPQGQWTSLGTTNRAYSFAADGTYRFHSETTGPDPFRVVDEIGTYNVLAGQLTLTPQAITTVFNGVVRQVRGRLANVTYDWSKRYVPASNEWLIVLTPDRPTTRDGTLRAGSKSYEYSGLTKAAWKVAPRP